MKKLSYLVFAFIFLLIFTACSNNAGNEQQSNSETQPSSQTEANQSVQDEQTPESSNTKSLVVYFSYSGNTETVAKEIAEQTNSDVFEIVPVVAYSDDYNTVVDFAKQEQQEGARPEILSSIENLEQYDTVYIGFPNWWGDMPMILYTFFDNYDLSGKTIAPFCTSGGSGLSDTVHEIRDLEPNATVTEGLHIRDNASSNPQNAVAEWLESNKNK